MSADTRLWTKDFVAVTLANFFLMINYFMLIVVMADYAMTTFGAVPALAGAASGMFIVGALVARLFAGAFMQTWGHRAIGLVGIGCDLLLSLTYFVTGSLFLLLAVRFLHGCAYGAASTALGTIVSRMVPEARRGEGLGYYMLSNALSAAVGPFIGVSLLRSGSFDLHFCALHPLCLPEPRGGHVFPRPLAGRAQSCRGDLHPASLAQLPGALRPARELAGLPHLRRLFQHPGLPHALRQGALPCRDGQLFLHHLFGGHAGHPPRRRPGLRPARAGLRHVSGHSGPGGGQSCCCPSATAACSCCFPERASARASACSSPAA